MVAILWFSCGAASAVACKIALEKYPDARIIYQETGSAHPDNVRFILDCEKWYWKKIETIRSPFYADHFDVIRRTRFINGPKGARCTTEIKRKCRKYFEAGNPGITNQIFGFTVDERDRAEKPEMAGFEFPLIENGITKNQCYQELHKAGIELPMMYQLGFNNNNCICCPKGGMGYFNHCRKIFPELFAKMALLEREVGHSCINGVYLDELDPKAGRHDEPEIACDLFCLMGA